MNILNFVNSKDSIPQGFTNEGLKLAGVIE